MYISILGLWVLGLGIVCYGGLLFYVGSVVTSELFNLNDRLYYEQEINSLKQELGALREKVYPCI